MRTHRHVLSPSQRRQGALSPRRERPNPTIPLMETHELRAGLTAADGRANLADWHAQAAISQMGRQVCVSGGVRA